MTLYRDPQGNAGFVCGPKARCAMGQPPESYRLQSDPNTVVDRCPDCHRPVDTYETADGRTLTLRHR